MSTAVCSSSAAGGARDELDVERRARGRDPACGQRGATRLQADPAGRGSARGRRPSPSSDRRAGLRLQAVGAPDHLVDRPEAELRHQLAHVLGDEPEVVLDELRLAVELLAQLRILRRDADRTGVQVADAHHDAARHDQRRRREAELLGAEQRRDHHVAAGLELAVDLHDDAVAEAVEEQDLLRLGEPELPGNAGVLDATSAATRRCRRRGRRSARRRRAPWRRRRRPCRRRLRPRASRARARPGWRSSGRESSCARSSIE